MKRFVSFSFALFFMATSLGQTQDVFELAIAANKTTSLVFPFAIRHVDRGTRDVVVEQVQDADNLLLVKAAAVDFPATNLSVVTADGQVYSFSVLYATDPSVMVYQLPVLSGKHQQPV